MKIIALLLVIAGLASATIKWDDLVVTYSSESQDPLRNNSFFQIPRTRDNAVSAGWVEVTGINPNRVNVYCFQDDPRFCIFFDSYGYIAGVQEGLLVSDFESTQRVYDMSRFNMYETKTIFGQELWTVAAYFQDPAVIATGGRSREWDGLTGTEGVWLATTDGYVKIPRNVEDLDSVWVKNACIPRMGTHYYYDMHPTTDCKDILPWFLIYREGTLTAIGSQGFGKPSVKDRRWYEAPSAVGLKFTVITGPQCALDWADTYGFTAWHIYLTAEPWEITCS